MLYTNFRQTSFNFFFSSIDHTTYFSLYLLLKLSAILFWSFFFIKVVTNKKLWENWKRTLFCYEIPLNLINKYHLHELIHGLTDLLVNWFRCKHFVSSFLWKWVFMVSFLAWGIMNFQNLPSKLWFIHKFKLMTYGS